MKKLIEYTGWSIIGCVMVLSTYLVLNYLYMCTPDKTFNRFKSVHWPNHIVNECGDLRGEECCIENELEGKVCYGITETHSKEFYWIFNFLINEGQASEKEIEKYSKRFIYTKYFKEPRISDLHLKAAHAVFDYAVHSGPTKAIKELQKNLGIKTTGIIGPVTIKASSRINLTKYNNSRAEFIRSLPVYQEHPTGMESRIRKFKEQSLRIFKRYKLMCAI